MAFEIERKYLVKGDVWRGMAEHVRIRQGYVATKEMAAHPFSEWSFRNGLWT